jgi:hypothetical protein
MAHTPGPWGYEVHEFGTVITSEGHSLGTAHGTIVIKGGEWPHADNARLMAAAPDLLQAMKELLEAYARENRLWCCNGRECGCMGITMQEHAEYVAKAAIDKAEGKT